MNVWIIIGVILIIIVALSAWVIAIYNKLVKVRNRVYDQWAQIDVQLKRRTDLIPNLVNTVKGYAGHENNTLTSVMEARAALVSAGKGSMAAKMEANNRLEGALARLMMVSEAYPTLKADTQFLSLQKTLQETEDRIAYSRQFYNDTVLKYKNTIEVFPTNIFAGIFAFGNLPFYEVKDEDRENVEVQF